MLMWDLSHHMLQMFVPFGTSYFWHKHIQGTILETGYRTLTDTVKNHAHENDLFILYKYEAPVGWISEAQTVIILYCTVCLV